MAGMTVNLKPDHQWGPRDFVGGALCLDFTNTRGGHHKIRENERLATYGDMVRFAAKAGVVDEAEAAALGKLARAKPKEAEKALGAAWAFRESLVHVLAALVGDGKAEAQAPDADLARVRAGMAEAVAAARLSLQDDAFTWSLDLEAMGLDIVLARIALSTQKFLTQESPSRVRQCQRCTYFYLYTSMNQRRRWCTPDICGNRSRANRHYEKAKSAEF